MAQNKAHKCALHTTVLGYDVMWSIMKAQLVHITTWELPIQLRTVSILVVEKYRKHNVESERP